nr:PREDICTED: uncharacterized protein LOC105669545 [Linepithema humile]
MKNIRTAIIKDITIKKHWSKHKCDIFSKHNTYESALKAEKEAAASSESEREVRPGKRKIKNNKLEDYVDYPGPPKLLLLHKEFNKSNTANNDSITNHITDDIPVIITQETNVNAKNIIHVMNDITNITRNIEATMESLKKKTGKISLRNSGNH